MMANNYGKTRNGTLLIRGPFGVFTVTKPVVAPSGTTARMKVSDTTVKFAGIPLISTPLAPVNSCPRIGPFCPTLP